MIRVTTLDYGTPRHWRTTGEMLEYELNRLESDGHHVITVIEAPWAHAHDKGVLVVYREAE
jgi:hypothetical protein